MTGNFLWGDEFLVIPAERHVDIAPPPLLCSIWSLSMCQVHLPAANSQSEVGRRVPGQLSCWGPMNATPGE